jgi:tetratricopeptide (TPR) repeat protein
MDKILQQGNAAFNTGNLKEAERLYRSILRVQPNHPDANHNLGLISVSMNQSGLALPMFKTAVEANPNIELFWLNYIRALITERQFEDAKRALKKGKKRGFGKKNLKALAQKLLSVKAGSIPIQAPSEAEIQQLLNHYENGRWGDAEKLASSLTQQFPSHQFAWKILGAVLGQTNRMSAALNANQRAAQLAPQDAEAHNNLGNTFKKLGRLDETEASYTQAIVLKADYVEAHCNLGNILQELGRLKEAEASYRQAIVLKSDYVEAHCNLGNILQELGRLEEAEASYRQAIALKPDFPQSHNNLGTTLKDLGRLAEAEASYRRALELKPDYAEAHNNLAIIFQELGMSDVAEKSYRQAIAINPGYLQCRSNLGMFLLANGEFEQAAEQFKLVDSGNSSSYLLRCLYLDDKRSLFFDQLDSLINHVEINPIVGSLGCRSEIRYGVERPNLFCKDPLKYVLKTDLNNTYDFERIFVKNATAILNGNTVQYRAQKLLTYGRQTFGNLFKTEYDLTEEIQKIIRAEVDKYRVQFEGSDEGLISNWPADYSIYGWLISMKSGGELRPHMHDIGWISGSIYINVPRKEKADNGNLVVCVEDENLLREGIENPKKIIDVVTGSLVLFPASLLHYTIPFESEEERIVLAFDIIPK